MSRLLAPAPPVDLPIVYPKPESRIGTLTPVLAQSLMDGRVRNRKPKKSSVQKYARDMLRGEWQLNGMTISQDIYGRMFNGENRCTAVLLTGVSIPMVFVVGLHPDAKATVDIGDRRTIADGWEIAGEPAPKGAEALARMWYRWGFDGSPTSGGQRVATASELTDIIEAHPQILDTVPFIQRHRVVSRKCLPVVQGFIHSYAVEMYSQEEADTYITDLDSGANLAPTDPVHLLRKQLVENTRRNSRPEQARVLAVSIKAFNAKQANEPMQLLKWSTGGKHPEPFPRFSVQPR
jgi:hypothetical protein